MRGSSACCSVKNSNNVMSLFTLSRIPRYEEVFRKSLKGACTSHSRLDVGKV